MLVNAFQKEQELREALYETWYDPAYRYYNSSDVHRPFTLSQENGDEHERVFASVDGSGNLMGVLGYHPDYQTRSALWFGALRFPHGDKLVFGRDLLQSIDDIFRRDGFNRLTFNVIRGNPAERMYNRYLPGIGGTVIGIETEAATDGAGNLCDRVLYEVMRKNYLEAARTKR